MRHLEKVKISIVVPFYNSSATLEKALRSIEQQTLSDYEVILVDDGSSDASPDIARQFPWQTIRNNERLGPAKSRNVGIRTAKGEIIAFMDSDCIADRHFLANIKLEFDLDRQAEVIAGNTKIPKSTLLGDCISELGSPGGANAGFERIWRVSPEGYTSHVSSCNFAARRTVFEKHGLFDESFAYAGGEDAEFSHRLAMAGVRIRHCPNVVVWHEPRKDLISFIRWQMLRGRGNYHFKRKVGRVSDYLKLRFWSTRNIIRKNVSTMKIFPILFLLAVSFALQQLGYLQETLASRSWLRGLPTAKRLL